MKMKNKKIKTYKCPFCGIVYLSKEDYDKHLDKCLIDLEIRTRCGNRKCKNCEL